MRRDGLPKILLIGLGAGALLIAACGERTGSTVEDATEGSEDQATHTREIDHGLARGDAPRMSAKLERTILEIDVLQTDIRFGEDTSDRLRRVLSDASGDERKVESPLADSLVDIALQTRDALVEIRFLRDIPLNQYLEETRKNLRIASESAALPAGELDAVARRLRPWFSFLEGRDLKEGDRLAYRIRGDTVRTLYWGADGYRFLDQTDPYASDVRGAVLGGYLAAGTDMREPLVESILEWPEGP